MSVLAGCERLDCNRPMSLGVTIGMGSRSRSGLRGGAALAVALAAALAIVPAEAAAAEAPQPSLWGTVEVQKSNLDPFPKWTEAMARFREEAQENSGACEVTAQEKCYYKTWIAFLQKAKAAPPLGQVQQVNNFMNQAKYIVDQINWNMKDYWATPGQFFKRFGDCEDYAVAKYMSLAALGFDREKMRIVVVQDLNLKVAHAVLAVEIDGQIWILDNQIEQVIEADRIRHYRPVYSVSEKAWWLHKQAG